MQFSTRVESFFHDFKCFSRCVVCHVYTCIKNGTFNHCGRSKAWNSTHHGWYVFQSVFLSNMYINMCAWCRHTQRRFEWTHGGVSESTYGFSSFFSACRNTRTHTPNTHHHHQQHTHEHRRPSNTNARNHPQEPFPLSNIPPKWATILILLFQRHTYTTPYKTQCFTI